LRWSLLVLAFASSVVADVKIRVVTWNVKDNEWADDGFTDESIDDVLGLNKGGELASIYAVGLQENCWSCDDDELPEIGSKFLARIARKARAGYEFVGIYGTRMSGYCEWKCKFGTHGTTLVLVIAKKGLVTGAQKFHQNDDCSSKTIPNSEKGVAALKVRIANGKTLCFGSNHLDSSKASYRRSCLKDFFRNADKDVDWSSSCDAQFLFGDFNTRTGDKGDGPSNGKHVPRGTNFNSLRQRDELIGSQPYGTGSDWNSNLLNYINKVQRKTFRECPFSFMPSYSLKESSKYCNGGFPCYRTNRPMSWTDRIIFTSGKCLKYDAIYAEYGDHFPVFAEFAL